MQVSLSGPPPQPFHSQLVQKRRMLECVGIDDVLVYDARPELDNADSTAPLQIPDVVAARHRFPPGVRCNASRPRHSEVVLRIVDGRTPQSSMLLLVLPEVIHNALGNSPDVQRNRKVRKIVKSRLDVCP